MIDEGLKAALDELEEVEAQMTHNGGDDNDEFYSAACVVVAEWRRVKNPKVDKQLPIQTGLSFKLMPDGSTKITSIYP